MIVRYDLLKRYCFGATGSNFTSNEPNDPKFTRAVEPVNRASSKSPLIPKSTRALEPTRTS